MLGAPAMLGGSQMLDWGREREIYIAPYFQDDWRVSSKLTLNLGLRYDLFPQPVDARDRGSIFNPYSGIWQLPGKDGFSRAIVDGDHLHFAPRGGFAYQVKPKWVVRGGFGIFYGMRDRNQETTQFSGNPPNTPQLIAPVTDPNKTISPPFTINTPILTVPTSTTFSRYSPDNPFPGTMRFTELHNAKFPYLEQANLSLEFAPKPSWLLQLGLSAGNGKHNTSGLLSANQLPFEAALNGHNKQTDRPFPMITALMYEHGSWGASYYRAVNFKAEKRFSSGLSFLINYTISKNLESMGSGVCTWGMQTIMFLDPYHPQLEKTYAALDIPQVFVASFVYDLPWGHGRRWLRS